MIDGITVLNQTEIMKINTPFMIFATVLMLIIGLLIVWTVEPVWTDIITPVVTCIIVMVFLITGFISQKHTGKYEYEVLIDEQVSMKEFNERYEIVEQNGKIYTIKERKK